MKTYQYTSPENTVVAVIDEDGISRMSMLASLVPDGASILPYPTQAISIPDSVTMRQARLALSEAGLLSSVNAAIASMEGRQKEVAEIEWEYAQEVQRNSGLVPVLGASLGLSEKDLDNLFLRASTF